MVRFNNWTKKECEAWQPKPPMGVAEFSRKNLYLSKRSGAAQPGFYRPDITPYAIEPLNEFTNRTVEKIVLCFGTQLGKTTILFACESYVIAYDPGSALLVMPSSDICEFTSKNRIIPLIEDCPALREKCPPRHKWSLLEIPFDGGVLRMVGANSPGALASQPVRYLFLDETAKFPVQTKTEAGAQDLAEERTKAQLSYKIMAASTPVQVGDNILTDLDGSDYRQYYVPCPGCGGYQVLIFKRIIWPKNEEGHHESYAVIRKETHYACEHCQGKIIEKYKTWMLSFGRWVKRGQRIEPGISDADDVIETFEISLPDGSVKQFSLCGIVEHNTVAGFHLNAFYSPFVSWGQLVEQFLRCKGKPAKLQNFVNSVLAEPWKQKTAELMTEKLELLKDPAVTPMVVPEGYDLLVLAADYHGPDTGVKYSLWAYAGDYRAALVDYGTLGSLEDLRRLNGSLWDVENGDPKSADVLVIDSGWMTKEVYWLCATIPNAIPIKGGPDSMAQVYSLRDLETDSDGRKLPGGMKLMLINPKAWKDFLFGQLNLPVDPANRRRHPVRLHRAVKFDFLESLTAEKRVNQTNTNGQEVAIWIVDKSGKNHWWDTSIYAWAVAHWMLPQLIEYKRIAEAQVNVTHRKIEKDNSWEAERFE
ncbi:MAG: phage terminase large subunit family protein [Phycisphaerae bacterium]|nr:phage terminase large subunit family protein [Phycisphaerae bacterium]